ncbi:hypothetical protein, partial [Paenibacillus rhizoplanae]|uniref:hypothetical protein n=1 Tax=Paenibacillus rhizoplanae TaxID=1917181 RepID=UPI0036142017
AGGDLAGGAFGSLHSRWASGTTSSELGGHSLKATQLVSWIQKQVDAKRARWAKCSASPDAEALARALEAAATMERYEAIGQAELREWYPASPAQQRLYVASQLDTGGIGC